MIINATSRFIADCILSDTEKFMSELLEKSSTAFSGLTEAEKTASSYTVCLKIQTPLKKIFVLIAFSGLDEKKEKAVFEKIKKRSALPGKILTLVFDRYIESNIEEIIPAIKSEYYKQIQIITKNDTEKIIMQLYLPTEFFRFFSREINTSHDCQKIEERIISFMQKPGCFKPGLKKIIETLDQTELKKLINHIQRLNLLSIYQISLLTIAYPEHSLKIKKSLSANNIKEVIKTRKFYNEKKAITKRDISEIIYSVEEAIFFLLKSGVNLDYSIFMQKTQQQVKKIYSFKLFLSKDFSSWIDEMIEKNLLYKTISKTDDISLANAFSVGTEKYMKKFERFISKKRIKDIISLCPEEINYKNMLEARTAMIIKFRHLKAEKAATNPDSLDSFLLRIKDKKDFEHLLYSAGWSVLSTALKSSGKKARHKTLQSLPDPASWLIKDVIEGTVNPGIAHDEIQVNRARKNCVECIKKIYEEGIIDLE